MLYTGSMETIKRWTILFVMCLFGLVACATPPTMSTKTAAAPTSTSMAVLPTDTLQSTDTPIPTPTPTLTPVPTSTPLPAIVRTTYVLTVTHPTEQEFRAILAQWHATSAPDNVAYLVLSKQELDVNDDGKSEYFVTGQHGMSGYYAIWGEGKEGWIESYYAEFPGKYAAQAQVRIEDDSLIVDSLGWTGGTGALQGIWTQDWITCETMKCQSIWKEPLVEIGQWAFAWVPFDSMAHEYTISQIDRQDDGNTIRVVTRHLSNQVPLLLDEPISLTVRSTMHRVIGPDIESLYRWDGENFKLEQQTQISPGMEVSRILDRSTAETIRLVNQVLSKLFQNATDSSYAKNLETAEVDFWGPQAARREVDGRYEQTFAEVAAHTGTTEKLGEWIGALTASDKGQLHCRLSVHRRDMDAFNLIGNLDLPCVLNFTHLTWADITGDGQSDLLLTTFAPDDDAGETAAGAQRLYVYDVQNGLKQIALINGTINGVDSVGVYWRKTSSGQVEILAGLPLIPMSTDISSAYWPDLHRRFQVYRWDAQTQSLVPQEIEVEP